MAVFKCKMCGGTIEFEQGSSVGVCDSCGTKQTLPKLDDDKKSALYDRANHFRRNNEFDKAMGIYEQILNEDNTDAEAYWSLVLCRYGIEYVEDPTTHKRVPTVNRAQYTSVYDDDNYKSALQYADGYQREIYEEEAKAINEIQKGILAISQKEEPFDVFICYKETDANGRRTQDSVLANDLYHQLTQEGFKVFFSRITLEDKLGTAYEPYIFAALNSAKVMVVLGTKPEYFNSVWVKNEWSRYLALVKQSGGKKILIPAYRDMDPYDLPEEFAHLQAQDMSKLGFMQDLIRGIKKLTESSIPQTVVKETVTVNNGGIDVETLLKRAFILIEDSNWNNANDHLNRVLDIEPENAKAYIGKLMIEMQVHTIESLAKQDIDFSNNLNFIRALQFADEKTKSNLKKYCSYARKNSEAKQEAALKAKLKSLSQRHKVIEKLIESKNKMWITLLIFASYMIGYALSKILVMIIHGYTDPGEIPLAVAGILVALVLGVIEFSVKNKIENLEKELDDIRETLNINLPHNKIDRKKKKIRILFICIPIVMTIISMLLSNLIIIPMSSMEPGRSWIIEDCALKISFCITFVTYCILAIIQSKKNLFNKTEEEENDGSI